MVVGLQQKRWDAGLGLLAVHKKRGVSQSVFVVQLPVGCNVLLYPIDLLLVSMTTDFGKFNVWAVKQK